MRSQKQHLFKFVRQSTLAAEESSLSCLLGAKEEIVGRRYRAIKGGGWSGQSRNLTRKSTVRFSTVNVGFTKRSAVDEKASLTSC